MLAVTGVARADEAAPASAPPPAPPAAAAAPKEEDGDLEDVDEALGVRGTMRTRAQSVSFDAKERSLELQGDVRVDAPPFHLRSDRISLSRTRYGIEADGKGRLAFCPCLGTPLTVEFTKAVVAPPGELFLRDPKLELYGVPVAYLPWFWLRSDEKIGVLPPDVAFRGQDGVYLGEGVHLPWKDRGVHDALDLRGGAYLEGGFVADARLRTPVGSAKIRYDRLPGPRDRAPAPPGVAATNADDGLLVDARGATHADDVTVAWDADVLRGRRGVAATSELDAAARPWDRATASAAIGRGPVIAETGVRAVTRRGGDLVAVEAAGPFAGLRSSGGLGPLTYDVHGEGGGLRTSGTAALPAALTPDEITYGRAEGGLAFTENAGPIEGTVEGRAAGDVVNDGVGASTDGAAAARLHVGAPLVRAFGGADDHDPWIHLVEPFGEAALVHAAGRGGLGVLPGRGLAAVRGTAPIASGGVRSVLGRWAARDALEATLAGGGAFGDGGTRPLARGRLVASFVWVGAQADAGTVVPTASDPGGVAALGRLRLGREDGVRLVGNVATREGLDPVLARALTDAPTTASLGFLAREGTTGGAGLVVPWGRLVTTSAGADADATSGDLVAVRGGLDLRDRCGCITVRTVAAHRIGRQGVDVWLTIDFAADR